MYGVYVVERIAKKQIVLFPANLFDAASIRRRFRKTQWLGHIGDSDVSLFICRKLTAEGFEEIWEASPRVTLNRLLYVRISVPHHPNFGKVLNWSSPESRILLSRTAPSERIESQ